MFIIVNDLIADDWQTGPGGKPSRHSLSGEIGPQAADLLWQGSISAVVAQQAVIDGDIVVMSRMFNINNVLHGTQIVAHNLLTGDTLWTKGLPVDFPSTDWRSRVSAFRDGAIYATRAGNTNYSYMYALNELNGEILWKSEGLVNESSTEGASFASNGDLIIGNFDNVIRINHLDGTTVWQTLRSCPTTGGGEVAVFESKGYYWEADPYGPKISVIDLESGQYLYSSEALSPGIVQQVAPFVGPDGTVYGTRTMNNTITDFLFALNDKGSYFEVKWSVPLGYVPFGTFGVGPDGSVYSYNQSDEVIRIDPDNGNVIDTSEIVLGGDFSQPRMAIDAQGYVFVTNGGFTGGAFHSFNPDLTLRWTENIANVNVGGPAIGNSGTLIVCGTGNNVRAYQGSYSLVAGFSSDSQEICAGDTIHFYDNSNGFVTSWEWIFEGGIPPVSYEENPEVVYPESGVFDISLEVGDGNSFSTLEILNYMTVLQLPETTFDTLPEFCLFDPPYLLTEGNPEGGVYEGPGVSGNYFYPESAGIGSHVLYYTFTETTGCSKTASQFAVVDVCPGSQELPAGSMMIVYPNPSDRSLRISIKGSDESGITELEILNSLGDVVYIKEIIIGDDDLVFDEINVGDWNPGLYFVLWKKSQQLISAIKFIVY